MLLTSTKLATALGMSKLTVLRLANSGKIPAYRLPTDRGDFRFDLDEVKAALRDDGDDR